MPVNTLKQSPMFNISLSSKELFHSNFFYWLWMINPPCFLNLLENLYGDPCFIGLTSADVEVVREGKNLDISVVRKSNKEVLYIIENKVKSVPTQKQLDGYNLKGPQASRVLLSLMQEFPDKSAILNKGVWRIRNYQDMADAINANYCNIPNHNHKIFIDEYCNFIRALHNLTTQWNHNSVLIFNESFYQEALSLRLHDLCGKLIYSQVAAQLENKLSKIQFSELKWGVDVSVSFGYSQEGPLFDIAISNVIDSDTTFIIQVQGDSYRHAVSCTNISYKDICNEMNRNDTLHNEIRSYWWPNGYGIKKPRSGNLGYNRYELKNNAGCFIHKYISLQDSAAKYNTTVDARIPALIDYIVQEVKNFDDWKVSLKQKGLIP